MPTDLLIDPGAQAQCLGNSWRRHGLVDHGAPRQEVRPDHHGFARGEVLAVGDGLFLCLAAAGGDISEGAQLLGDGDECGSDRLGIQARHAEDARYHAQAGLGGKQGLHAGVLAIGADAADDRAIGRGFILARLHPHHHSGGVGLVGDCLQACGQRTAGARLADGSLHVGDEYRRIEWKGGGVGVFGGGYQADDRGGDGANGAGPVIDLLDRTP